MLGLDEDAATQLVAEMRVALAAHGSMEALGDATCALLRARLGERALCSVYLADGEYLWLAAQRGYAQVIPRLRLTSGLFARAYVEQRTILVEHGAAGVEGFILATVGIDSMLVVPFAQGVVAIESGERMSPSLVVPLEGIAATLVNALRRKAGVEPVQASPARRLAVVALRMAALDDRAGVAELAARSVGELLELECVQIAEPRGEAWSVSTTWIREPDRGLALSDHTFGQLARGFAFGPSLPQLACGAAPDEILLLRGRGADRIVGLPLRVGSRLVAYLIGAGRGHCEVSLDQFEQAELVAAHAASTLDDLQSRADLGAAQDRLNAALRAAQSVAFSLDLETAEAPRVIFLSGGAERLLGAPKEGESLASESLADVWMRAVHAEDHRVVSEHFARLRGGAPSECEYRLVGLDGETRWARIRGRPRADAPFIVDGIATDVTAQHTVAARLADAESWLETLISKIDENLFSGEVLSDGSYRELYTGPNLARLLGGEPNAGESIDEVWERAIHPEDQAGYRELNKRLLRGEACSARYRLVGLDGITRWVEERSRPRAQTDGRVIIDGIVADISVQVAQEADLTFALAEMNSANERLAAANEALLVANEALEELRHEADERARSDSLTGLFNRRHFREALAAEVARATREDRPVAIVLLDIDRFKQINDTRGHQAGDAVLIEIAARLRQSMREYDVVARYGGEEFIVLAPGVPDAGSLRALVESVRARIADQPIRLPDGSLLTVTASAGAHLAPASLAEPEQLIHDADQALYAAKRRGRNQTVLAKDINDSDSIAEEPETIRLAQGLALATSVREATPDRHPAEVADLAARIAQQLQLPATIVMRCRLGGWLHDAGKLALPDRILARAGNLNDRDRTIMQSHVTLGADIVSRSNALRDAATAVRHHHERYDGTGYPDRLAGDKIPLEARIVAAADAYSAITNGRAYQPPLCHAEALKQLTTAAGRSLDPTIVDALHRIFDERRPSTANGQPTIHDGGSAPSGTLATAIETQVRLPQG